MKNSNSTSLLLVDLDYQMRQASILNRSADLPTQIDGLKVVVKAFSKSIISIAITPEHCPEKTAFMQSKAFKTVEVNGNRPEMVRRVTEQLRQLVARDHPCQVILVTADRAFAPFCQWASTQTNVSCWLPQPSPALEEAIARDVSDVRLLSEVLPQADRRRVDVRLDYDNLHIGLEQNGYDTAPEGIIQAIKTIAEREGEIVAIHAYADWGKLSRQRHLGDIQRRLVALGVKTHYLINERKNVTDIEMYDQIRTAFEETSISCDTLLICTGDGDFTSLVETLKSKGIRISLVSLRESLSKKLAQAAHEVHYLEPYLSQRQPAQHTPAFSSPVKDPQQSLAMHIAVYFIRHPGEQLDEMRLEEIFAALPERREVINQAISGKLLAIDKTSTFRLHWIPNQDSVEMQRALRIARWLRKRLYYLLSQKRMEYVDTHYLAEGMLLDQLLTREGLVSTYAEAVAWLELAREAGLVTAQKRSHPKYENREIYIWSMV